MPVKPLADGANLQHLKRQAKDLLKQHAAKDLGCAHRLREFHPQFRTATDEAIFASKLSLSEAQLTIARERGFADWARLKRHLEKPAVHGNLALPHHDRIDDPEFKRAVNLIDTGDVDGLRRLLKQKAELVRQRVLFEGGNYFRNPSLLEFIAENPVRHGRLPANIGEVAEVMLNAEPEQAAVDETLGLVATGRVPRECGVQTALLELLCRHGANPSTGLRPAAFHREIEAVKTLIRLGAKPDLPVLVALNRSAEFDRTLSMATGTDRHLALAAAAIYGRTEMVQKLLGAGEDPNRYNPLGAHSHATPLHDAAGAGHLETVRALVEHGARLDIKDLMWNAVPADWAQHERKAVVEKYLREQVKK